MQPAALCLRWAVSRRNPVIPTVAQPASRRRMLGAKGPSWSTTRPLASANFTKARLPPWASWWAGLAHPSHLRPMHILKRVSPSEVKSFAEVYTFLEHRELISGVGHTHYSEQWALADAQHFAPLPQVQSAA